MKQEHENPQPRVSQVSLTTEAMSIMRGGRGWPETRLRTASFLPSDWLITKFLAHSALVPTDISVKTSQIEEAHREGGQ